MLKKYSSFTIAIIVSLLFLGCKNNTFVRNEGMIYGTFYHIIYQHPQDSDIHYEIKEVLKTFDYSLSTFNKNSTISKINSNTNLKTDSLFEKMYLKAREISEATDGAFDLTVATLVNYWGFGYESLPESGIAGKAIDSIMQFTGYRKVELKNGMIVKSDPRVKLDASAIAKGQSVDIVADFLESKGITNYMVEIGGEVRVKGQNPGGSNWIIGIDLPEDDPAVLNRKLIERIAITNKSLATSGNYRNFYIRDGIKFSHTINPATGYPVNHNLLSVSVITNDCMTADAIATACMVLGVDKSLKLSEKNNAIDLFLIYSDSTGTIKSKFSPGFEKYIIKE